MGADSPQVSPWLVHGYGVICLSYSQLQAKHVFVYSALCHGRDLVLLCTSDISRAAQEVLAADGWDVRLVSPIANPGTWTHPRGSRKANFPARFWGVYTKLHLFNLTEYERGSSLLA